MEHVEIVDRLSEYIDDELSAVDKELVERHLATCVECAERLAAMRAVTGMIAATPRMDMPADAADRLTAAIDERVKSGPAPAPKKKTQAPWRRWAASPAFISAAGAAAVLVVAVAVWTSPAHISGRGAQDSRSLSAPSLSAPEAGGRQEYGSDQPQAAETDAGARRTVDKLLDEAAAGELSNDVWGMRKGQSFAGADSLSAPDDRAAKLAGRGQPVRLIYSTSSEWFQGAAWIVIVERTDKPGYFIGAVVSQKDGRILYRRTKQQP